MKDSHKYLVESEKLIRNHGLPKPVKSQKVSKLHHIFSFLKIIEESTIQKAIPLSNESGMGTCPSTSPSSPLSDVVVAVDGSQLINSRLEWLDEDELGDSEDSLFVSIYQIPTALLSLLSQTSSLCKDLTSTGSPTSEFSRRCQIIEDRIFNWKPPENLTLKEAPQTFESMELESSDGHNCSAISAHIVAAMHHALIVHFQRQIRKTDPRVLQHYVMNAANHLVVHEKLKKILDVRTTAFPWPCFIVGCEAYDLAARQKVEEYLDLVRDYNVGSLVEVERVIREVWRRQDLGQNDKCWDNVLGDWGLRIILT
jgi:arginine metabolism regulation protein II